MESAQNDYWAGRKWPEEDRLAVVALRKWHDAFFAADYAEVAEGLGLEVAE